MDTIKPPLTRGIKLSYGVGQAAEGIKNAAFNVFVFFYYTQVLGLPTVYTGIAIGIALAVDSITDPLIGSLSDNWQGLTDDVTRFYMPLFYPWDFSL